MQTKVVALFLSLILSSVSIFAQDSEDNVLVNPYQNGQFTTVNQIELGSRVNVRTGDAQTIDAYAEASIEAAVVNSYSANTILEVVSDAVESDGLRWWQTEDEAGNRAWIAEAVRGEYDRLEFQLTPLCQLTENRIAFVASAIDHAESVFTMNQDGTEICNLLFLDYSYHYMTIKQLLWSPDGSQLAVIVNITDALVPVQSSVSREGKYSLYLFNADGSNVRLLVPELDVQSVSWSPDGSQLALAAGLIQADGISSNWEVWRVNADGTNASQLTTTGRYVQSVAWSPNEPTILYSSHETYEMWGTQSIHLIAAEGGTAETLYEGTSSLEHLTWSPDGQQIAFSPQWTENPRLDIALNLADRTYLFVDVPQPTFRYILPAYSPDSTRIAFWTEEAYQLVIVGAKSGRLMGSTNFELMNGGGVSRPVWSNDGRNIYFVRGDWGFWRVDTSTLEAVFISVGVNSHLSAEVGFSMQP